MDILNKLNINRDEKKVKDQEGTEFLAEERKESVINHTITDEQYYKWCDDNNMLPDHPANKSMAKEDYFKELESEGLEHKVLHKSRILVFRGSDETTDRHGDIVRVEGWDTKEYLKNPVFLVGHDYNKMPVGRTIAVWKDHNDSGAPTGKSLKFAVHFPAKNISKESDATLMLYKSGLLNATSVGFMPLSANNPVDQDERDALGLGPHGVEFTKQKLWELSAVTIPSNSNALVVNSAEEATCCKSLGIKYHMKDDDKNFVEFGEGRDELDDASDQDPNQPEDKQEPEEITTKQAVDLIMSEMEQIKQDLKEIKEFLTKSVSNEDDQLDEDESSEDNDSTSQRSICDLIMEGIEDLNHNEHDDDVVKSIINKL